MSNFYRSPFTFTEFKEAILTNITYNPQIIADTNHPKSQRFDLAVSPVHQAT